MPIFGEAYWPGVRGFIACEYTCSHGSRASIAALTIPDQNLGGIATNGTLIITDGFRQIQIRSARVVDVRYNGGTTTTPRTITLMIADRRWMWDGRGAVAGKYNQVDPEPDDIAVPVGVPGKITGPYIPGTERTATELIQECFRELNCSDYLINPAPQVAVPVVWEDTPPAAALQEIMDQIGYRLIYRPIDDSFAVNQIGMGTRLPLNLPITASSPGFSLPRTPAEIWVAGGATMYADWLMLEPIGLEENGRARHIDDLSYRPLDGWVSTTFGKDEPAIGADRLQNRAGVRIGDSSSIEASLKLAREHIWKLFRVRLYNVGTAEEDHIYVGGYGKVTDRRLIKLHDREYFPTKTKTGRYNIGHPSLVGCVYLPRLRTGSKPIAADAIGNTYINVNKNLPLEFQIDTQRGWVRFNEPVTRMDSDNKAVPPVLYLSTSFEVLRYGKMIPERYFFRGRNAAEIPGCPPDIIERPEMHMIVSATRKVKFLDSDGDGVPDKDADGNELGAGPNSLFRLDHVDSNQADLDRVAEYFYGTKLAAGLAGSETQQITYAGIWPIEPNGYVQQVTWRVGGDQPAQTTASANTEHAAELPRYPEKRRVEQAIGYARTIQKMDQGSWPTKSTSVKEV